MDSTYLDIFVLTVLALSAMKGFNDGFITESKMLVSLLLGIFVANNYPDIGKNVLNDFFKIPPSTVDDISIFVSFVGVAGIVYISSIFLQLYILRSGSLGFYDRFFGLLFSGLKVVVIMSIILYTTLVFININKETSKFLKNSISYKFLHNIGNKIMGSYVNEEEDFMDSFVNKFFNKKQKTTEKLIGDEISKGIKNIKNEDENIVDKLKNKFLK